MRRRLLPSFASPRRRRASEAGFALPTVLFVMLGAFAIGSVAAIASIGAQKGTTRDHNTKTAIAAAEAGVSQALLRYNRVRADDTTSNCLVVVGDSTTMSEQPPGEDGWCDGVAGQTTEGSPFTYWVRPTENQIEIVSQGSVGAVTRRVEVTAISKPQPGLNPFENATLIGLTEITLDSNAHAAADVATNGNVTMQPASSLCGDAQVGEPPHVVEGGSHLSPSSGCTSSGSYVHGEVSLPPVNQGDVPEDNSNDRFFDQDPIHGQKHRVCWDGADGNGAPAPGDCGERELNLKQNSAVTLGGSNYSFCKLTMSNNTTLYTDAGATVNIFFDSPESCGYDSGETQLQMQQNSSIKPSGGDPTNIALLFVGSESEPPLDTYILLRSNTHANAICGQNFVIYAPLTEITLDSNSHYCGAMAGKSIHLNSNAQVRTSNLAQEFNLPNTEHWSPYWRDRFVECSGPAPEPPNEPSHGC